MIFLGLTMENDIIIFIPDLFCLIAEHFDDEDWKAIRITCRRAEELFSVYCRSVAMAFRCGRALGCPEGTHFPVDEYPHNREFNHEFYWEAALKELREYRGPRRLDRLGYMHFKDLTEHELFVLAGAEGGKILRDIDCSIHNWISKTTGPDIFAQLEEKYLVDLARDTEMAGVELQKRGLPYWDIYEYTPLACPSRIKGSHAEFMAKRLQRAEIPEFFDNKDACLECLVAAYDATGDVDMLPHALMRILDSPLPDERVYELVATIVKRHRLAFKEISHRVLAKPRARARAEFLIKHYPFAFAIICKSHHRDCLYE